MTSVSASQSDSKSDTTASDESVISAKKDSLTTTGTSAPLSQSADCATTPNLPVANAKTDLAAPTPPMQPKRPPTDPTTKVINDLRDAFPNIEDKYITAVLIASQGNVDPAFNALLYISDPTFEPEIPKARTSNLTLGIIKPPTYTDDELLARKLQQEFEREDERRRRRRNERQRSRDLQLTTDDVSDSPDEFEQIKETFSQGIEEARTTLNGWVTGFAKRLDSVRGELSGDDSPNNTKLFGALGGLSFKSDKVSKTARFDDDPHIINDFRDEIHLDDNDTPPLPTRRAALGKGLEKGLLGARQWQAISQVQQANSDAFLVTDSEEEEPNASTSSAAKK